MDLAAAIWGMVGCLVAGAVIAFFVTRYLFKKQLRENPPVNEKMIRVMLTQMGRKPSEAQVRQIMKSMNDAK